MGSRIKLILSRPEISASVMFIAMLTLFSLLTDKFFTANNLSIVCQPIPEIALVAIGVTILMISGEFDLSVGSTFVLTPMLMLLALKAGAPMALAITLGLAAAACVGLLNAFVTLRIGMPSFIATLGTMFVVRSLALVASGGFPPAFPHEINADWLVGRLGLARISGFYLLAIAVLAVFWLRRTDFGSWIFATGGNPIAARDLGINTKLVKTVCFAVCALAAGFAGVMQACRIRSVLPNMGDGLELVVISAAVIGGVALSGGTGSVLGAIIGTLLIACIQNILILTRVDANWFKFAVGSLIVLAVSLNALTRSAAERIQLKEPE
jgi:ribose/xylose/arabinose/galactoside ABC-type transport system permease subunit